MDIVVDFQGFTDNNNKFVIKECAVLSVDHSFVEHWIVRPPYGFYELTKQKRKEAVWLKSNHHGLRWDDGGIQYHNFIEDLRNVCCGVRQIFAKGKEKCATLKFILCREVIDLGELNTPSLKSLMKGVHPLGLRCFRHCKNKRHVCSLSIVDKLRSWILNNGQVFF